MKKIIPVIVAGFFALQGSAQSVTGESAKTISVSEASRQQNAGGTLINGKPYAQYKAEQDALKVKQQQPAQRVQQPQEITATPGNIPARQQPVQVNTLKGNETAEPAPMVNTKVEAPVNQASREPVTHVVPSMDASTPNAAFVPAEKKASGPEKPAQVAPKVIAPVAEASQPQQEVIPAMPAGVKIEKEPVQVEKTTEPKADPSSTDSQPNPQAKTKTN